MVMEALGWIAALMIGVVLGLVGAGGSILTIPILVYLFAVQPVSATAYSLFVVGVGALAGVGTYLRNREIDVRSGLLFLAPSALGVFATRRFLLPAIPPQLGPVTKDHAILILFALLMVAASLKMIRGSAQEKGGKTNGPWPVVGLGLAVGILAGLVGAGGGFLIIPALVLYGGLPMRMAIGTSLAIIGIQSLIGFSGDVLAGRQMDWPFLLGVTGVAIAGVMIGSLFGRRIAGAQLRVAFGWLVLAMGVIMLVKESLSVV